MGFCVLSKMSLSISGNIVDSVTEKTNICLKDVDILTKC